MAATGEQSMAQLRTGAPGPETVIVCSHRVHVYGAPGCADI